MDMLKISGSYFFKKSYKHSLLYLLTFLLLICSAPNLVQVESKPVQCISSIASIHQQNHFDASHQAEKSKFDFEAMLEDSEDEDENEGDHVFHQLSSVCIEDYQFNELVYTSYLKSLFSSLMLSNQEKSFIPIFVYQHSWKCFLS